MTEEHFTPDFSISFVAMAMSLSLLSIMKILKPSLASSAAYDLPIPEAPPETEYKV